MPSSPLLDCAAPYGWVRAWLGLTEPFAPSARCCLQFPTTLPLAWERGKEIPLQYSGVGEDFL